MADIKISQLGEALAVTDNDVLPMTASGVTSKVKASTMKDYMIGNTNISDLGDGTPTGAIDALDNEIDANYAEWKTQWKKNGAYNLLENTASTQVVQGVTFTVNPTGYKKGAIKLYSTAAPTGGVDFKVNAGFKLPAGTYKLCPNDFPSTANSSRISVTISGGAELAWDANYDNHAHCIFTLSEEKELIYHIYMNTSSIGALDNIIIYPMITTDLNATPADFEEFAKTNRELTEDALTANDVAFVKEAFNLQANSSKTITLKTTVSLLVGVYGSNGFAYLIHDNGGVYQIANSNDGISASLSTHTLTITNSGSHSYRTRLLELGQS